ncbi:MAG: hypothetical protein ACRDRZ_07335 [Pseudonocardiaceae bacterium]
MRLALGAFGGGSRIGRRTPSNVDGEVRECELARFDLVPGGVEVVVP